MTVLEHLDNLIRHINLVRDECIVLGKKLINRGETDFGRLLIARGFAHDLSKFHGIEFLYLHNGKNTDKQHLELAIKQHVETNMHHPEYFGGIHNMDRLSVFEMCVDWAARSQEFLSSLNDWIDEVAIIKYNIDKNSIQYKWIQDALNLMSESEFVDK